jgi:uncharacterized membrane protein
MEERTPSHYKLGIFYYNKNDKRIFPPKRNPNLGWTINFANPYSVLAFVALLTAVYFFSTWLGKQ